MGGPPAQKYGIWGVLIKVQVSLYRKKLSREIRGYQQLELLMLKLVSPQQRSLVRFSLNKPLSSDFDLNKQLLI